MQRIEAPLNGLFRGQSYKNFFGINYIKILVIHGKVQLAESFLMYFMPKLLYTINPGRCDIIKLNLKWGIDA